MNGRSVPAVRSVPFRSRVPGVLLAAAGLVALGPALAPPVGAQCPGTEEVCNHADDDCDGLVDEGFPQLTTVLVLHDTTWGGNFLGRSLAVLGDVDGDEVADLVVGYPGDHADGSWRGSAWVVSGATRAVLCRAYNDGTLSGGELGNQVAALGDVDGDDVPDFAAAAYHSDVVAYDAGEIVLFSGADCSVIRHCTDPAGASQDQLGEENALAGLGDVTGDGVPDLVAGAARANVAALSDSGKAIVFSGADCSVVRTLVEPSPAAYDYFGLAVAGLPDVTGDGVPDVAVGEHRADDAAADGGAVLIFSGADGAFVRRLVDPNAYSTDYLGWAIVAIDDLDDDGRADLAVSARNRPPAGGYEVGQVIAFATGDGAVLWRGSDPAGATRDYLGWSIAAVPDLDGDGIRDVLAGAPYADTGGVANSGRAVAFSGADGTWLRSFVNPQAGADDLMGFAVAGPGDLEGDGAPDVVVGVSHDDVPKHSVDRGAVLFLHPESDCDGDGQGPTGTDCDDADPVVHAGAAEICDGKDDDCNGAVDEDRDGDGYDACEEETACASAVDPNGDPLLHPGADERCNGIDDDCDGAVDEGPDADGDDWTLPCDCDDGDAAVHPGATETCDHVADGCVAVDAGFPRTTSTEKHVDRDPIAGDAFGLSLTGVGDVDGDGVPDFAAGTPYDDSTAWEVGQVTVFSGADRRVVCRTAITTAGALGTAIAGIGDATGDGVPDLAVSSRTSNRVVVISGDDCRELVRCSDTAAGTLTIGWDHALAPWVDVTGDGRPEFLAGADNYTPQVAHSGRGLAFTIGGSHAAGLTCSVWFAMTDPDGQVSDQLGYAIAGVGDLTGDGFPDVVAGEPGDDSVADQNGAVLVFSGVDGSFAGRWIDPGWAVRDALGQSVATLGDVDGDGWPDVAAGAEFGNDGARADVGKVVIFSGRDGTVIRRLIDPGAAVGERLGWSIAAVDDVDGDRIADVLVGGRYADPGGVVDAGRAVVFSAGTGAVLGSFTNDANRASAQFGWSVASPGDLDGDGVPEFLVGAPFEDGAAGADVGSLSVFAIETECDGDGLTPFAGDCDDADADLWRVPGEAVDLEFGADRRTLTWLAPGGDGMGTPALLYDTLRATGADGFAASECVETDGVDLVASDPATPDAGGGFYYLVRAGNACGDGDLGTWGAEAEPRVAPACP